MSKNDNLQNLQAYIHEDSLLSQILSPTLAGYDGREYFESLNKFSAVFHHKNIYLQNLDKSYPLGTFATEAINFIIDLKMKDLQPLIRQLYKDYQHAYLQNTEPLSPEAIRSFEQQITVIDSHLEPLTVFKDRLNKVHHFGFEINHDTINQIENLEETIASVIVSYIEVCDTLIAFYEQIYDFSRTWITEGSKQNGHDYSLAYEDYFYGGYFEFNATKKSNTILPRSLSQFLDIKTLFATTKIPEYDKPRFSEIILFNSYLDLLQYDYFRALQNEYTVRVCRNCKLAFLNTTKHHTIYCDQIAPNETTKTCRQVGALNSEKEKIQNSPIHQLYLRCYKKISARYRRNTITQDEYNKLVTDANKLKDDALKGEITIDKLEKIYNNI